MACANASQYDAHRQTDQMVRSHGWRGQLALRYQRRGARTVLVQRQHVGPLLVQKPFYPEGERVCHGIVLHPPGGIVGGDELELDITVDAEANALLTTPGATKWYRSAGAQARQSLRFHVQRGASLEWLPQPAIAFNHVLGCAESEVVVAESGCYIGWELLCLGRTAAGEKMHAGRMLTSMRIMRAGEPVWLEHASIEGGSRLLESPAGLAGQPISGTLLAVAREIGPALVSKCRAVQPAAGRAGVTRLPGLIVARYLGDRAEAAHDYFVRLWQVLRPALLGREAEPPRIWRT